jgi:DNA-binding LacI/PurR family transcriptional regulator
MNDVMAIGAMQAVQKAGIQVGRDFGVTGFDDTPTARYLTPPLTSISQPISTIGENLMKRLIEYLETGAYPDQDVSWSLLCLRFVNLQQAICQRRNEGERSL